MVASSSISNGVRIKVSNPKWGFRAFLSSNNLRVQKAFAELQKCSHIVFKIAQK